MGAAGVLNGLVGEEETVGIDGGGVEGAILRGGGVGGGGSDVFEEKDDAVDGTMEGEGEEGSATTQRGDTGTHSPAPTTEVAGGYGHARSRYLNARMLSGSNWISSSNWTSLTPSCSMRKVKTPCPWFAKIRIKRREDRAEIGFVSLLGLGQAAKGRFRLTSSDSIVLHPPAEASSAMIM